MHSTKLIELLRRFSAAEWRKLVDYINSPLHNKHEKLIHFVDILYKESPALKSKNISKRSIFNHLFPKEAYVEQRLNDLMSYLMKHLEEFLAYEYYKQQAFTQQQYLVAALREKKLEGFYKQELKNLHKKLEKYPYRDHNYYFNSYLFETEQDFLFLETETRDQNDSLQKKGDALDIYYLYSKLKNCCEMINRQNIISSDYSKRMLEEVLVYLKRNIGDYQKVPAIIIYYTILLTLRDSKNEQHYIKLKKLLDENTLLFSDQELKQMYDYLKNYCIRKLNAGDTLYLKELFELYKFLLDKGFLLQENYLTHWTYKNIVSTALRLKEHEWTKDFIHEYKDKINAKYRENAYIYNLASLHYSQKDYSTALKLLQEVEFVDIFYHLGAKSMLLKIFYELQDLNSFYSLIDAFRVYLKRNKLIAKQQYEIYLNLIKFTKKAFDIGLKIKEGARKTNFEAVAKLKEEVQATKNVANLSWLMERITELEKETVKGLEVKHISLSKLLF